jgi:hypothetical protein
MPNIETDRLEELKNETAINYSRLFSAFLYVCWAAAVYLFNYFKYSERISPVIFSGPLALLIFGAVLFFLFRGIAELPVYFKFFCVSVDMLIINGGIYMCGSINTASQAGIFQIQIVFCFLLIIANILRRDVISTLLSGVLAGVFYFIVMLISQYQLNLSAALANALPVPGYYFNINGIFISVLLIGGGIAAAFLSSRQRLFIKRMVFCQSETVDESAHTIAQTQAVAGALIESTGAISSCSQ